jgi:hypothetical protein
MQRHVVSLAFTAMCSLSPALLSRLLSEARLSTLGKHLVVTLFPRIQVVWMNSIMEPKADDDLQENQCDGQAKATSRLFRMFLPYVSTVFCESVSNQRISF